MDLFWQELMFMNIMEESIKLKLEVETIKTAFANLISTDTYPEMQNKKETIEEDAYNYYRKSCENRKRNQPIRSRKIYSQKKINKKSKWSCDIESNCFTSCDAIADLSSLSKTSNKHEYMSFCEKNAIFQSTMNYPASSTLLHDKSIGLSNSSEIESSNLNETYSIDSEKEFEENADYNISKDTNSYFSDNISDESDQRDNLLVDECSQLNICQYESFYEKVVSEICQDSVHKYKNCKATKDNEKKVQFSLGHFHERSKFFKVINNVIVKTFRNEKKNKHRISKKSDCDVKSKLSSFSCFY